MKMASILSAWSKLFNPDLAVIMLNIPHNDWFPEREIKRQVLDKVRLPLSHPYDNRESVLPILSAANDPFLYYDAIYCINLDTDKNKWEVMQSRFKQLGIENRVRRFSAIKTPGNHNVGCALSHRSLIGEAKKFGHEKILVLEDDACFHKDILHYLPSVQQEIETTQWCMCYLGGAYFSSATTSTPRNCKYILSIDSQSVSTTHAIAYHSRIYDRILEEIPENLTKEHDWIKQHLAIDQYYLILSNRFIAMPMLAMQEVFKKYPDSFPESDMTKYTI